MKRIVLCLLSLLLLASCGEREKPPVKSEPAPIQKAVTATPAEDEVIKEEVQNEVVKEAPEISPETVPQKETKPQSKTQSEAKPEEIPEPKQEPEVIPKNLCRISVTCEKAIGKKENLPEDGVILAATQVEFTEGESVFEVLERCLEEQNIPFEYREDTVFNSVYIEGIGGLFEKDCSAYSGWMYKVNGSPPTCAVSDYMVKDGDVIEFYYSC